MSNIEFKHDLVKLIMALEDTLLLEQLKGIITGFPKTDKEKDWIHELSEFQRQQIKLGKHQIKNGDYFSNEDVEAEINAMLDQKRKK